MGSPLAWLAGLGRGASSLGQDLNAREVLAEQQKRQAANDALQRLVTLQRIGGTEVPQGADPSAALASLTEHNRLRSGGAIPNAALGIPDETVPDAFGAPSSVELPTPDGRMSRVLIDPSKTPEAQQERRFGLQQTRLDRRQQTSIDAQNARDSEGRQAATLKSVGEARGKYNTLKAHSPKHPLVQQPFSAENAADYGEALDLEKTRLTASLRPEREDRTLVPVQQPDGSVVYMGREQAEGQQAPSRAAVGSASLKKARATNAKQLSVIDDALKELTAYPDAVGLKRGVGELIPGMGNVGDAVNQRKDPEGINARSSIANIGSLVIHERSGAAVTVSEFPRLAPFVPRISDTPEAVQKKLTKLRAMIQEETDALNEELGTGGDAPPTLPKRAQAAPGTQAMATVPAPPKRDDHTTEPSGGRTITVNGKTFKVPN